MKPAPKNLKESIPRKSTPILLLKWPAPYFSLNSPKISKSLSSFNLIIHVKGFKLDRLDFEILEIIEQDCSKTYAEIAESVNANLWTVRDRLNLLKSRGIIQGCKGVLNYQMMGFPFKALIQLNLEPTQLQEFISFVRGQKNVKNMMIITGSERIFLTVIGSSVVEIREFIQKQLSRFNVDIRNFNMVLDEPVR